MDSTRACRSEMARNERHPVIQFGQIPTRMPSDDGVVRCWVTPRDWWKQPVEGGEGLFLTSGIAQQNRRRTGNGGKVVRPARPSTRHATSPPRPLLVGSPQVDRGERVGRTDPRQPAG